MKPGGDKPALLKKISGEIFNRQVLCMSMRKKRIKAILFRYAFPLLAMTGLLLLWTNGSMLYAGWIKILYPNGGEVLNAGAHISIQWQSGGVRGKVVIVLYKKGIKHAVIAEQADNSGKFSWTIPVNLPEGSDYRIRIRSFAELSVNDFSDHDFTIKK